MARTPGEIRVSAPLLDARALGKRFGAVVAADEVTIRVNAGERVSLIGTNGAGKTTFVNMVTGYLKPDTGSIHFDGQEITARAPTDIVRLGVNRSFQIPQLFLQLTLEENLLAALSAKDAVGLTAARESSMQQAEQLMERFGLTAQRNLKAVSLPGGLRKLLDIAMVVALRPKLLMLDEPTSGVAASEKYTLMDTVQRALEGDGTTVMFIEHDMDIVRRYSERVIAFAAGRVIADGPPAVALQDAKVRELVTGEA
jgi:branched-chain amino acid transport system ATP-binding protein